MPKKSNRGGSSRRTGKRSAPMTMGMKFFLVGCVAELYVMVLRRYYIVGSTPQMLAWFQALPWVGLAGLAVLAAGAAWAWARRKDPAWRLNAVCVAAMGGFLALASFAAYWNQSTVNLFFVVVPACMLLCVFWSLYDRSCALSLTILCVSLVAAWVCYRATWQLSPYRLPVKIGAAAWLLALALFPLRAKKVKPLKGADLMPVYLACGLSAAAMAASLIGAQAAWYAMWCLALAAFGLVVYYTVRQL